MFPAARILSAIDSERLLPAIERARSSWLTFAPYLDSFGAELRRSQVLPPAEVPADVITMNSRFSLLASRADGAICYTLVYPGEEAPRQGKVSVMTPMGTALLGARVGEEVHWVSADGPEVGTVERLLYQPEASGHFRV
jgi:regulator of nucleoside diphosphate kinase